MVLSIFLVRSTISLVSTVLLLPSPLVVIISLGARSTSSAAGTSPRMARTCTAPAAAASIGRLLRTLMASTRTTSTSLILACTRPTPSLVTTVSPSVA